MTEPIRRRWPWGAGAFLLMLAVLTLLIARIPHVYESTARVLVEPQRIPVDLVRPTVTSPLASRLSTTRAEILSRSRLERIIAEFGLHGDRIAQAPVERVIEQMREDVKVELTGGEGEEAIPTGFTVSYRGRDPRKVALVANSLASSFIEANLRYREAQAAGTANFLRGQLEDLERRLQEQEKALASARRPGEAAGPAEARVQAALRQYETTKETHKFIAVRLRDAALAESMEQRQMGEQFRLIDPAAPSGEPIAPNRPLLYTLALGVAAAAGFVAMRSAKALGRSTTLPSNEVPQGDSA